jgi:alkylation response protein AidB-like acyl-CoA dehydrogenase
VSTSGPATAAFPRHDSARESINEERPALLDSRLESSLHSSLAGELHAARAIGADAERALVWAAALGARAPRPGEDTVGAWELLASVAAVDVGVARILEPHLDAVAILSQTSDTPKLAGIGVSSTSTWGVYAAEGGGNAVVAFCDGGQWMLRGVKPWCSLAQRVSHALVTARLDVLPRQVG